MRARALGWTPLVLLAALAGAADAPEPYRIGTGDVLDVEVWREPDLSGPHRVDDAGEIHHVLTGAQPAAGRTCAQVAAELRERLERAYLREARVVVTVAESARRRASVLGAVTQPGVYPVNDHTRVIDLLFSAGGAAPDAGGEAELVRRPSGAGPERIAIDLAALLERGDTAHDVPVRAGDVLVVKRREEAPAAAGAADARVRITGEVTRPGVYPLAEAPTLLDAVLVAGGLTEYAAADRTRLVRGEGEARRELRVELDDLLGGGGVENPALQPGDLIVVPESYF